ncbi:MAG: hypothetical protein HZB83_02265 [Deltaproteobacteria bacterium]|nr:hypothetical protein [Deltaproteobacteria bacterium]
MDRDEVIRDIKAKAVDGYLIEGVPFFPQDEYMCGPAALASVIGYHGPPRGEAAGVNRAMVEVAKEV